MLVLRCCRARCRPPPCPCTALLYTASLALRSSSWSPHTFFARHTDSQSRAESIDALPSLGGPRAWLAATAALPGLQTIFDLFSLTKKVFIISGARRSQVIRRVHWKKHHQQQLFFCFIVQVSSFTCCLLLPLRALTVIVIPLVSYC